ncbi:MAG: sigma-70 family RNA polymerase sigma factor [Planctomycetota bacterium]
MARDPDFDLIKRCQSDDPDVFELAFDEIFSLYKDRVYNTAYRVVGNAEDALDVSQEVFVTVFRKIHEFQFGSRFFTWLYRIVINLAIDHRRRLQIGPALFSQAPVEEAAEKEVADQGDALNKWAEDDHLERKVQLALGRLSPKLRAIVVLRYFQGLAYHEIAETLGCSLGTVKSRLNRAHLSLQEFLQPIQEPEV